MLTAYGITLRGYEIMLIANLNITYIARQVAKCKDSPIVRY